MLQTQNIFPANRHWRMRACVGLYSLLQSRAFAGFLTGIALATSCICSHCGHESRSLWQALLPTQGLPVMTVSSHYLTYKPKLTIPCFSSVCRTLLSSPGFLVAIIFLEYRSALTLTMYNQEGRTIWSFWGKTVANGNEILWVNYFPSCYLLYYFIYSVRTSQNLHTCFHWP